jgi:NAD(P)-dependent dehydrogenase (short-subunit alcohol dehydrogenase family)
MAKTFGPQGIRVNCLCPGLIETPLWQQPGEPEPEFATRWRLMTPLRRPGTAAEVAQVALFLASDDASFITGQEIVVDGGFSTGFLFESSSWLAESSGED